MQYIKKLSEYNTTYILEVSNIDKLMVKGDITLTEYKSLLADAYSDYMQAIATV